MSMRSKRPTPLWPAGHLPHKGGDQLERRCAPKPEVVLTTRAIVREGLVKQPQFDVPPCGGDARQGRGGCVRQDADHEVHHP
jgi:hypothetical protein